MMILKGLRLQPAQIKILQQIDDETDPYCIIVIAIVGY